MSGLIFILTVATIFGGVIQAAPPDAAKLALLLYRERCVNISGSDEAFYQLFRSFEPAKACIFEHVGEFRQQTLPPFDDYSSREEFFGRVCPKLNESVSCLKDVFEATAKCTTEAYDKLVTILNDTMYGLIKLICRENGQLYYGIKTDEFSECLIQVKANAIRCKASEATRTVTSTPYSMEQCRDVTESRDCFKGICNLSTMDKIADEIYGTLLSATDCPNDL